MAVGPQRVPTFPVWVGDLKQTVKEQDLHRVFSSFGNIANCKIILNEQGLSRHFGYVNFYNEVAAERAALARSGFLIHGSHIKTKGPRALMEGNHFSPPPAASAKQNFRPITDCLFGLKCGNGPECPYRHKDYNPGIPICPNWKEKRCYNIQCPNRHPGGKEITRKEPPPRAVAELFPAAELIKCEGRCGNSFCKAHFENRDYLGNHVRMTKKPQCLHCRAIFLSEIDFSDHQLTCVARPVSGSTDHSSDSAESADIEVISNNDFIGEETPGNQPLHFDGFRKSQSETVFGHISTDKLEKRKTRHYSENDQSDQYSPSKVSSTKDKKKPKHRNRKKVSGATPKKAHSDLRTESEQAAARLDDPEGLSLGEWGPAEGDVDSSEEDEEVEFKYSHTEIVRLLSLNQQDMYDTSDEGDSPDDRPSDLGNSGRLATKTGGKNKGSVKSSQNDAATSSSTSQNRPYPTTRLEPVGVFWDIENCPVPVSKSAFAVASKMRRVFFSGKREAEFMCVCDITKERKDVIDSLHKAQVTLVHVNAVAKNAADDKLRQSLRRFAHTYPSPSTVVLISGDVNFSPELNDLRYIHNIAIVLVHSPMASIALKEFANSVIDYDSFIEDVDSPSQINKPVTSQIVIVSDLPRGASSEGGIKNRLGQLSDNCGGKVLSVDVRNGKAKVLFRTHDLAVKSMKRMNGEDVFGSRIKTSLQPVSPYDAKMQQMANLSGSGLSKSFPPKTPPPTTPLTDIPQFHSPHMRPHHIGVGRFTPAVPRTGSSLYRPPPPQRPPNPYPLKMQPSYNPQQHNPQIPFSATSIQPRPFLVPTQHARGPPSPIKGKILVFKIPPVPEAQLSQLNGHMVSVRLEAFVKATHLILWHNFSELQVLLDVDLAQTALVRREDLICTLHERGELKQEIAQKFIEGCVVSIGDVICRNKLPWDVTPCGWSADEEVERVVRSQVIALLRQCEPSFWTKWNNFKKRYLETYSSAISEMAIHNACKGAVQILGDQTNVQSQIIVFYELSPLVKLGSNAQLHSQLKRSFSKFLSLQPDKKIKLLDFVKQYTEANVGALPIASSGKLLQELLSTTPNVTLVGGKPSTIYVVLTPNSQPLLSPAPTPTHQPPPPQAHPTPTPTPQPRPSRASAPKILHDLVALFHKLLKSKPNQEIPLSRFQQEYQTFFHHSFRVSDYIPGPDTTTRQLLQVCGGLVLQDVLQPNGRKETIVGLGKAELQNKPPVFSQSNTASSSTCTAANLSSDASASEQIPKESVQLFAQDCVEVLLSIPDQKILLVKFPEAYTKLKLQQFTLAKFNAKKLLHLVQAIPSVVQLSGERDTKSMELIAPSAADSIGVCERRVGYLLYSLPNHEVSLDRFMLAYETVHGRRLSHFYGHSKLSKLLESFAYSSVNIKGCGGAQIISLNPLKRLAFEINDLMTDRPEGLPISAVVPGYKERFGVELDITKYGFPKLIKLLEAITDVIDIRGLGASRTLHQKVYHDLITLEGPSASAPPTAVTLPPTLTLIDQVTALLLSTPSNKMTVNMLTKKYNEIFHSGQPRMDSAILMEGLSQLENFKVTSQYVQHVTPVNSPVKAAQQEMPKQSKLMNASEMKGVKVTVASASGPSKEMVPPSITNYDDMPALVSTHPTKSKDNVMSPTVIMLPVKDAERLTSETRRLLLYNCEHALTLSELVECFKETQDPVTPTVEQLLNSLINFNNKGGTGKQELKFQISYFSSSIGDSIVQLNRHDCLLKLAQDLQYLFIYHPTNSFSLPLSQIESLYTDCFGWRLSPAVYGSPSLELLFDHKEVKTLVKLDGRSHMCTLPEDSLHRVLACLLTELIFLKSEPCNVESLPHLYQEHFGCDLQPKSFHVETVSDLLKFPKVSDSVISLKVQGKSSQSKLALSSSSLLGEQLRHLLVLSNGLVPFQDLPTIYLSQFGAPSHFDVAKLRDKRLFQTVSSIVNLAGDQKWLVWAPNGRPYPATRKGLDPRVLESDQNNGFDKSLKLSPQFQSMGGECASEVTTTSAAAQYNRTSKSDASENQAAHCSPASGQQYPTHSAVTSNPSGPPVVSSFKSPSLQGDKEIRKDSFNDWPTFDGVETLSKEIVSIPLESSPPLTSPRTPKTEHQSCTVVDPSPYGFLEKELGPELMAELITNTHLADEGTPSNSDSATDMFDYLEDDLPPKNDPALDETYNKLMQVSQAMARGEPLPDFGSKRQEEEVKPKDLPEPLETGDYLATGMDPEQVLKEFMKVKESVQGVLTPELMDPFLTYFGEMSGQAIERMEAEEEKKKPKKEAAGKKKRTIAIRFPGQPLPHVAHTQANGGSQEEEVASAAVSVNSRLFSSPTLPSSKDVLSGNASDNEGMPEMLSQEDSSSLGMVPRDALDVAPIDSLAVAPRDGLGMASNDNLGVAPRDGLGVAPRDGLGVASRDNLGVAPRDGLGVASRDNLGVASRDNLGVVPRDSVDSCWVAETDAVQMKEESSQVHSEIKVATIRENSVTDWRHFLLSAVNYPLSSQATMRESPSINVEEDVEVD